MALRTNRIRAIATRLAHCPEGEPVIVVTAALALYLTSKEEMGIGRTPAETAEWFRTILGRLDHCPTATVQEKIYLDANIRAYLA